jgi:2',3'-cyclic-nucleotide 2'-phosphodiesterase/3'-nucleotidase
VIFLPRTYIFDRKTIDPASEVTFLSSPKARDAIQPGSRIGYPGDGGNGFGKYGIALLK